MATPERAGLMNPDNNKGGKITMIRKITADDLVNRRSIMRDINSRSTNNGSDRHRSKMRPINCES